jgi:hypothetical protein
VLALMILLSTLNAACCGVKPQQHFVKDRRADAVSYSDRSGSLNVSVSTSPCSAAL